MKTKKAASFYWSSFYFFSRDDCLISKYTNT